MIATRTLHRLTVDEYEGMIASGALAEDDRVELIRGEVVPKMPIGDEHAACVGQLTFRLTPLLQRRALVWTRNPIRLAASMPEPDLALVHSRDDFYRSGKPRPADIDLVIEVADSSLATDRDSKATLYAENGIPEYGIVNLNDAAVEVHRGPRADGTWTYTHTARPGHTLDALPGLALSVADILGRP